MSLTATTLAAAMSATDLTLTLTSATGFAAGQLIKIDDEYMVIASLSGTVATVYKRGDQGTAVVAHGVLAPVVTTTSAYDWPKMPAATGNLVPPFSPTVTTYGASGAIAIPDKDGIAILDKAGVGVMTLADPTTAQDGRRLTIISATAQAHTVTNTTGFNNSGTAGDVATFGGAVGDNFEVMAVQGKWDVIGAKNVTLG